MTQAEETKILDAQAEVMIIVDTTIMEMTTGSLGRQIKYLVGGAITVCTDCRSDRNTFVLFGIVVFDSTMGVIRSSIAIILEEVPPDTDWNTVYEDISKVEGVSQVHDLHIWSISHGVSALSVHCQATDPEQALETILGKAVCGKHNIAHPTIQIQQSSSDPDCLQSHNDDKNCY
mmetsp:Transcript_34864/g.39799  ORF Transcript_34864/g.39799 Transcript_34864/m.39799 type:complete len:175 (-) Transcript_34864:216-740(-)